MSSNINTSPEYSDRSLPRHSTHNAKRSRAGSRASSLDHRLSIIAEDGNHPPPQPPIPQTHNRPFSRRFLGEPPRYRDGKEPPKYSLWDVTGPKGEKFDDLRNNAYVAGRGGWKRICLIVFIVIACTVGLIVGLVVGLRKKNSSAASPASPSASPSPSPSPTTGPFPAGSYTLQTFLDTTSTNCTSNSSSWSCHPYVTYATSPTDALTTFNWIISPATSPGSSPNAFTISSTANPFTINFNNVPLSLNDPGSPDERYNFTTKLNYQTLPSLNVICFFNDTQFTANMYTKKPKSYPSNSAIPSATAVTTGTSAGGAFANWNFAVDVTASIGGGVDVPACYNFVNSQVGERIATGYTAQPAGDFCSCAYKNYDP